MNENFKKVFLDTTPIIYLLDSDKNFGEKTCEILSALSNYLVYPYRLKNEALIKSFWELVSENKIILYPINQSDAIKAAQIRVQYKHFKQMDSLQLAIACMHGCDLFLTNDKQLKQFQEIKCLTVEEWEF